MIAKFYRDSLGDDTEGEYEWVMFDSWDGPSPEVEVILYLPAATVKQEDPDYPSIIPSEHGYVPSSWPRLMDTYW